MMHFLTLALLTSWASTALAAPAPSAHVLHERRTESRYWNKLDRVHHDVKLPVRIGLTQSNLDNIHDWLMDVSRHDSPKYGDYYSAEQVHDMFAPSQDRVDAVKEWLERSGIHMNRISQSVNKQWIQFDAKTSEVEALIRTKYHFYEHVPSGKATIACDEYHLPEDIASHVDYITPGVKLYAADSKKPAAGDIRKRSIHPPRPPMLPLPISLQSLLGAVDLAICSAVITPPCIAAMYNITKATKANPNNKLGIFEDLGDVYAQEDLNLFFAALAPQIPQGTHPVLNAIDGAVAPNPVLTAGPESDLDFEISYPIIYPQNSILFQTDDPVYEANYTYDGFLNNFLDAIDGSYCSLKAFGEDGNSPLDPPYPNPAPGGYKGQKQCGVYKPTNVISISYGGQEPDLSINYQKRQCLEFAKLGLQGVSIVVASGDSGVGGRAGDDSANGCIGGGKVFSPDFPATCPYITTLGATFLPPGASAAKDQEVAVTRFPSGGGFSNIYSAPSYQQSAVSNYFATSNPPYKYYSTTNNQSVGTNGGVYNRIGRGYPDFAAVGDNVVVFTMGAPNLIGGTSASAPVFAAILNRINEERLAVGKRTIGFVNPILYAHPEVFHDITTGSNPGCGTNGFAAAKGWDPVTGLGTPNYPALLKLFLAQR